MRSLPAHSRKIPLTDFGGVETSPKHLRQPAAPGHISKVRPLSDRRPISEMLEPPPYSLCKRPTVWHRPNQPHPLPLTQWHRPNRLHPLPMKATMLSPRQMFCQTLKLTMSSR